MSRVHYSLLIIALLTTESHAQAAKSIIDGIAAEAMLALHGDETIAEMGVGVRASHKRAALDGYVGGAIIHDDDIISTGLSSPYQTESFSNGQTVCRDTRNGQFARMDHCNGFSGTGSVDVDPYARFQLSFKAVDLSDDASLSVGAGLRLSSDSVNPYGLVSVTFKDKLSVRAMAAANYQGVGVSIGF